MRYAALVASSPEEDDQKLIDQVRKTLETADPERLRAALAEELEEEDAELEELRERYQSEVEMRVELGHRLDLATRQLHEVEAARSRLASELDDARGRVQELANHNATLLSRAEEARHEGRAAGQAASLAAGEAEARVKEAEARAEALRAEVAELREQLGLMQSELDLRAKESDVDTLQRLGRQASENAHEAEDLREKVRDLEAELEMRIQVIEGLQGDYAEHGELHQRIQYLDAENREMTDRLSMALSQLEALADRQTLQEQADQALDRLDEAVAQRDQAEVEAQTAMDRYHEAEDRARKLETEMATLQVERQATRKQVWVIGGAIAVAVMAMQWALSGAPPARPPAPTVAPTAGPVAQGPAVDVPALEAAAHRALGRLAASMPPEPAPPEARREDLSGYPALLAAIARGEPAAPHLEAWRGQVEVGASDLARRAAVLGRLLFLEGKEADALALVDRALGAAPEDVALLTLRGELLLSRGDLGAAEAAFRQAIARDPSRARAHGGLGNVLELQGKDAEAVAAMDRALTIDWENPQLHFGLASLLRKQGDHAKAVEHLEACVKANPDDAYSYWYLSLSQAALGDDAASARSRARAYELGYRDESDP